MSIEHEEFHENPDKIIEKKVDKEVLKQLKKKEEEEKKAYRKEFKSNSVFDKTDFFDKLFIDTEGRYGDEKAIIQNIKYAQWKNKSFSQKLFGFDIAQGFKNRKNRIKRFLGMKHEEQKPVNGAETQAEGAFQMKKFNLPDNFFNEMAARDAQRKEMWDQNDIIAQEKKEGEELRHKAENARIDEISRKLSAGSFGNTGGALYRGFNMPYGAGFGAPGPSIADKFSFSGGATNDQLVGQSETINVENPVEVLSNNN